MNRCVPRFSFSCGLAFALAFAVAAGEPPSLTALANPTLRYAVPEKPQLK